MPPVYPGGLNTFVPAAQAALQTNFTQNPAMFTINQYVTVAPVQQMTGYYLFHDPNEETRINYANMADARWPDGAMAQINFSKGNNFLPYYCERYRQTFAIGDLAVEQASWQVLTDASNSALMRLMTIRTYNVLTALTTGANWGSNTGTATAIGGGRWDAATSTNRYIQKTLNAAFVNIQYATNATVDRSQLRLVIDPLTANAMAQSQEITDYLKQSFVAKESLQQSPGSGFNYGLPDPLYGFRVIVEDRVSSNTAHGSASNNQYILGNNALIVAQPGALIGPLNTMSTATLAMYQDVQMNIQHDNLNLLTNGVLYDNYATIVRPESGYLITSVIA